MIKKTRLALTIAITLVLTVIGMLIALNFTSGEKNVGRKLTRLYQTQDPQFHRAMGSLLGPGILGGNRTRCSRKCRRRALTYASFTSLRGLVWRA